MGYEVSFIPTEEKMRSYKPWNENTYSESEREETCNAYKRQIIHYCMKPHDSSNEFMAYDISMKLKNLLRILGEHVKDTTKYGAYFRWKEDEGHCLWYCGWEFSHRYDGSEDDVYSYVLDKLCMFADVIKTDDYFAEKSNFYDKLREVEEAVNYFVDEMNTIKIHEIIEDLEEFREKYDEDDEDFMFTPEFKKMEDVPEEEEEIDEKEEVAAPVEKKTKAKK